MDNDAIRLADLRQLLAEMTGRASGPRWSVFGSGHTVPCYAVYQRRYWAVVLAILDLDHAVVYLTAKPNVTEDPLSPTNVLMQRDGQALACANAATSYLHMPRPRKDPTPDHFDQPDPGLISFVTHVVASTNTAGTCAAIGLAAHVGAIDDRPGSQPEPRPLTQHDLADPRSRHEVSPVPTATAMARTR